MNKEKIFSWIKSLEDKANESNKYFIERNNLYAENQKLHGELKATIECSDFWNDKANQLQERIEYLERSNNRREEEITLQRQEIIDLEETLNKIREYLEYNNESLYTFEPDYDYEENIVDNYEPSSYREELLEILKGDSNEM